MSANRRGFLAGVAASALPWRVLGAPVRARFADTDPHIPSWDDVPAILGGIAPPIIPARRLRLTEHGAKGDGVFDCSDAFARAIADLDDTGGGWLIVPAGAWSTGPIHLKSNINLHVEEGATIRFKTDPHAFPIVFTRWEGVELMNYSPLVYAIDCHDIAITGKGTLDGGATDEIWWPWKGKAAHGWRAGMAKQDAARNRLFAMGETGVPVASRVFGDGSYLRPNFIQPYRCKNVLIEGVTLKRSPMWQVHPVLCESVIVRGLTIDAAGPNTDGCDPESCRGVLIEDCFFNTGDDCIAIKSGRNGDGRRIGVASEDIVIRNCTMRNGHGAATIGSEISGGVHRVFVEKCRMDSPNLVHALRIKNNAMRGGKLEWLYFRDIAVGQVARAVLSIDETYEEGANGPFQPVVSNVFVERVVSGKSAMAVDVQGLANAPVDGVTLKDCDFANVAGASIARNVRGLEFHGVTVNGKPAAAPA
ncbi:MAG TPA: glycoside hydrolase family 28 protein [Rhizomicrobium sp.]|jgi:polygalacturonase|nr:glycoside hydrolase family 28 protein [Rhizomicrobium sp.]